MPQFYKEAMLLNANFRHNIALKALDMRHVLQDFSVRSGGFSISKTILPCGSVAYGVSAIYIQRSVGDLGTRCGQYDHFSRRQKNIKHSV